MQYQNRSGCIRHTPRPNPLPRIITIKQAASANPLLIMQQVLIHRAELFNRSLQSDYIDSAHIGSRVSNLEKYNISLEGKLGILDG